MIVRERALINKIVHDFYYIVNTVLKSLNIYLYLEIIYVLIYIIGIVRSDRGFKDYLDA